MKEIADDLADPDSVINICLKECLVTVKNANEASFAERECAESRIKHDQEETGIEIQSLFSVT